MTKPKILLVDDVELFLEIQKDMFRRESFTLFTARGGWEALETMHRERPDLVFMDLFMPQGRGDEACAKAKRDLMLRSIPIVIVTNDRNPKDLSACRKAGCDDILFKPVDRDQYLTITYRFLGVTNPKSSRVSHRTSVHFGPDQASLIEARLFDIGLGGIFVETAEFFPLGTEVYVKFDLPSPTVSLTGKAKVVRINRPNSLPGERYPEGIGLQFLDFNKSHLEILQGFLKRMGTGTHGWEREIKTRS